MTHDAIRIVAKYPGKCSVCGGPIDQGQECDWSKRTRTTRHTNCTEQSSTQGMEAPSLCDMIVEDFKRIFHLRTQNQIGRHRGTRSGKVMGSRAARISAGYVKVFEQKQVSEESEELVPGSLAICFTLQDLDSYRRHREGVKGYGSTELWAESVKAVFEAAKAVGLPVRLFGASVKPYGTELMLREYDSADSMLAAYKKDGTNSWTRQREAIKRAEEWHKEINAKGQRITLLLTMWPEMRDPDTNRREPDYKRFLEETGQETAKWTIFSKFFALGLTLGETTKHTWGAYQNHGLDNHFRDCFPSANRFMVDEPEDLREALRELGRQMVTA